MTDFREEIIRNAAIINQLHKHIHFTFQFRYDNDEKYEEWSAACENFRAQYDSLAFPGGWAGALDRILEGDSDAMEAAICFFEVRPYFFRSGYMFKDILRKAKKAPLFENQRKRLETVAQAYKKYRAARRAKG